MRHAPRWLGNQARPRADGVYYEHWCCKDCFWDWGVLFGGRPQYRHEFTESNHRGLLKQHWKTSRIDYFTNEDME